VLSSFSVFLTASGSIEISATTEDEMQATETLAINKLVSDKAVKDARKQIAPGTYLTDFWLRISGSVEIGEKYVRRVPQKAQPWLLLAVALSHLNGVTVESIVREAMSADPEMVADIKARADAAVVSLKGMTETACSGRIKANLNAEVVENPVAVMKAA